MSLRKTVICICWMMAGWFIADTCWTQRMNKLVDEVKERVKKLEE